MILLLFLLVRKTLILVPFDVVRLVAKFLLCILLPLIKIAPYLLQVGVLVEERCKRLNFQHVKRLALVHVRCPVLDCRLLRSRPRRHACILSGCTEIRVVRSELGLKQLGYV